MFNTKRLIFAFILLCFTASIFSAQTNQSDLFKGTLIPERLKPLLTKRIKQFIEVQRQKKWESIFDFLSQGSKNPLFPQFTNEQKQCVIEQFKTNPMSDFTILKTSMTTYNLGQPLNKRIWFVDGDAILNSSSGESKQSTSFNVRYFNQNWFFSIPEFYDEQWRKEKYAQVDFNGEMKELLRVVEQPDSPLEIFDISVKIRPTSYTLRDYNFKVKNKTKKSIISYAYRFIESGIFVGSPNDIKLGQFAYDSGFYTANHVFCEDKERPVRIYIDRVQFSDGTRWQTKFKQSKEFYWSSEQRPPW